MNSFIRRNVIENVQLGQDEKILQITRHHTLVLLSRLLPAFVILLITGGIIAFRAAGGQFMDMDAAQAGRFAAGDVLLLALLVLVIGGWFLAGIRASGRWLIRTALTVVAIVLVGMIFFRQGGGRMISFDTVPARTFDTPNVVLLSIALLTVLAGIYIVIDWASDQLILTNQRVIIDIEQPWVQRVQEQLPLGDIQSVSAQTKTYIEHWFNLGSIKILSASFSHVMMFTSAGRPKDMQKAIMAEVEQLRKASKEADFRRMVETRVYSTPSSRPKREPRINRSYTPRALGWLFEPNPTYDQEQEVYTWHPHWFFLVKSLLGPVGVLVLALLIVWGAISFGVASGGVLWLLPALTLLVVVVWSLWEIEDHRNDRYILTPSQIVDIEKKPLGPERRQSAGLEALQNVTSRTTLFGRIMGYGDVVLETAGPGEGLTFYDVPNPREVVATVNSYQAEFRKSQKERNLEDTLKLLRQYHLYEQQQQSTAGADQPQADRSASLHPSG